MTDDEIIESCELMKSLAEKIIFSIRGDQSDQSTIMRIILNYFSITEATFKAKSRDRDTCVWPRHFYFLFCKALTPMSLARIGISAGHKDHATVLNGIKSICKLIDIHDQVVLDHYEYLLNVMEGNGYSRKRIINFVSGKIK
jgi:chromosomal replication initiation ATPase DnaA